jgi:hypothetical protein
LELPPDLEAAHSILTDGDIAVLRFNHCGSPKTMVGAGTASPSHFRGRLSRVFMALRNDLGRSNILFTTCNTFKYLSERRALSRVGRTPSPAAPQRGLDWLSSLPPADLPSKISGDK